MLSSVMHPVCRMRGSPPKSEIIVVVFQANVLENKIQGWTEVPYNEVQKMSVAARGIRTDMTIKHPSIRSVGPTPTCQTRAQSNSKTHLLVVRRQLDIQFPGKPGKP